MWLLVWIEDIGNQYEVKSEYGKDVGKGDEKGDKDIGSPTKKRKKEDDETEDDDNDQDQDKKTEQMLAVSAETPNQPQPLGLAASAFRNHPRFVPLEKLYAMQGQGIFAVPSAAGAEGAII